MEYIKNYIIRVSNVRARRLEEFLKKKKFKDISDPVNKKHYQYVNKAYANIDQVYQNELVVNIYFGDNLMTLQTNLDGEEKYLMNTIKFLKLLYSTCYSILKNDDYQSKKWSALKRYLERSNRHHLDTMYSRASKVSAGNMNTDDEVLDFVRTLRDIFDD